MLEKDFRFNLEETAGAIGDYGTLIPIIIGVAAVTEIELSTMLFFFGLAYIGTGFYYKLPMPVEPMKAIGAITISGGLKCIESGRCRCYYRCNTSNNRFYRGNEVYKKICSQFVN